VALVNPARLAWGLREACLRAGVRIFERTTATGLEPRRTDVLVATDYGRVAARYVVLATNAFPSLVRRVRPYIVPVYDYVLVTEPLSDQQLRSIGWSSRCGLADAGNQFHYYRLTEDNRILWGGYDAIYHYGARLSAELDQRPATFRLLAANFFETFPQLHGLRFTHRWGGAIDTCSRFSAFYGTAAGGRIAYALGFTGLGVGATRFAAEVMLDRLAGQRTERTELAMVRSKPMPFPPEPLRWLGIELTRRSLARADRNGGRRNLWLRGMDALGLGFDS
jgi:glycine/D-amino acid oxidase-like deaminating enzyme